MPYVDGDDEFEKEGGEIVEDDFVFFNRRWRRGFNQDCCRNLLHRSRSSRSGSQSRRVPGFSNDRRGVSVFGCSGVYSFGAVSGPRVV